MVITQTDTKVLTTYGTTIDAVVYGLADGGVKYVTGYPGFHAQEIIAASGGSVSINERTAFSIAWGAAMAGQRSAVVLKNVGLNDAADPFVNSINLRTSSGLVVVVLDDVEVAGSQCRQDSRHFFDLAPGLWFEPISAAHAYDCARAAASLSETMNVPVVLRLTNESLRGFGMFRREPSAEGIRKFRRDPVGCVAHPMNVAAQRTANYYRASRIERFVETQFTPSTSSSNSTVAVGSAALSENCDSCHVWTYPLPADRLRTTLANFDTIDVMEAGGSFATEKIKAMFGIPGVEIKDVSATVDHSASFRSSDRFDSLFKAMSSFDDRIVIGDLGSYTMDRHRTIDACLCYGASVAVAIGCGLSVPDGPVFCVTGDAAFLHSGKAAMEEANTRGVQITIILIDNGGAVSTGGQSVPAIITFAGARCVVRVNHETTSVTEYKRVLDQLVCHPGVTVLHVEAKH